MRDQVGAVLLVVVGNQPVIHRGEQLFEEQPGTARDHPQGRSLRVVYRLATIRGRAVRMRRTSAGEANHRRMNGRATGRRSGATIATITSIATASSGVCHIDRSTVARVSFDAGKAVRGDPLEQAAPGDQQTPERAADRVEHQYALVELKRHPQHGLLRW